MESRVPTVVSGTDDDEEYNVQPRNAISGITGNFTVLLMEFNGYWLPPLHLHDAGSMVYGIDKD